MAYGLKRTRKTRKPVDRLNGLEGKLKGRVRENEENHSNWFDDILSIESSVKQEKELIN